MSNICDFDRILKIECNLQHFTRNCKLKVWMTLKEMSQTRIFKCEGERSDHMLHYEQVGVFERKESKFRGVLIKHRRKVKGGQVITL